MTVKGFDLRSDAMGLVYADLELINGDDLALLRRGHVTEGEVRRMVVNALVDSGALMLTINEEIKTQLGLQQVDTRSAQLADGTVLELPVVGPVEVRFANRRTSVDAMVLPGNSEPLLGAIPMEDMDVLVDPQQRRLVVNPEHPYIVQHSLK
jgi:clan AA aspartic protease